MMVFSRLMSDTLAEQVHTGVATPSKKSELINDRESSFNEFDLISQNCNNVTV